MLAECISKLQNPNVSAECIGKPAEIGHRYGTGEGGGFVVMDTPVLERTDAANAELEAIYGKEAKKGMRDSGVVQNVRMLRDGVPTLLLS